MIAPCSPTSGTMSSWDIAALRSMGPVRLPQTHGYTSGLLAILLILSASVAFLTVTGPNWRLDLGDAGPPAILTVMSKNPMDITGHRFGRLIAAFEVEPSRRRDGRKSRWFLTVCDCGSSKSVMMNSLNRGLTRSCGCLASELAAKHISKVRYKHGATSNRRMTPEFKTWRSMIRRCESPSSASFKRYGAVGIKVCDRWRGSFANFLEDMGSKPCAEHTIDRLDNAKGYFPGNCRWATKDEQVLNRKRIRWITIGDTTMCIRDWAAARQMEQTKVAARLRLGWTAEQALDMAPRPQSSCPGSFSPKQRLDTSSG